MLGTESPSAARFGGTCALAFLVLFAYALARPPVESEFLRVHGAEMLPWVWAAVALGTIASVSVYSRFATRRSPVSLLAIWAAVFAIVLGAIDLARAMALPGATFALYVWKDVHVVVLLEIVWSFANAVFTVKGARSAYGLFCACGSIGGIAGNLASGELADRLGTGTALWAPLPALAVVAGVSFYFAGTQAGSVGRIGSVDGRAGADGGIAVVRRSPYLVLMLVLILLVQVSLTLLDYAYNQSIEATYTDTDVRTHVMSRVYASIDGSSLLLQLATAPVLRALGVPRTLLAVPAVLGSTVLAFLAAPRFIIVAVAKISSKALDYSVFKAAKEILYIPLSYEDKTRGKAMIDMLTYRVAKGGASLLLLGLLAVGIGWAVPWLVVALVVAWLAVTLALVRRYRRMVPRTAE